MAEYSGPWDGVDPEGADAFKQDRWRQLLGLTLPGGHLMSNPGTDENLEPVLSTSDRIVTIGPGAATIQGHLYINDAAKTFDIPVPSGSNQRIDYIALRYDPDQVLPLDRSRLVLILGQEASTAVPPGLAQDPGGVWEEPRLRIGPYGAGAIAGAPTTRGMPILPQIGYAGSVTDPPERLWAYSKRPGAMLIGGDGVIWRYDPAAETYVRVTAVPLEGDVPTYSSWQAYDSGLYRPMWRKSPDGQVTFRGLMHRKSGAADELTTSGSGQQFTGALPTAIRNPRYTASAQMASMAVGSSTGSKFHMPVRVTYQTGAAAFFVSRTGLDRQWQTVGAWISLDNITWWV